MTDLPDPPLPDSDNFYVELMAMYSAWKESIESKSDGDHSHGAGGVVVSIVATEAQLGIGTTDGESKICADTGYRWSWSVADQEWSDRTLDPEDVSVYPMPDNVMLTGNVVGLDYAKTSDNEITIEAGFCKDSTNKNWLTLSAPQVLAIPTTINTVYNLFFCDDGIVRVDTNVDGASLIGGSVTGLRWIGFVRNNASGTLCAFTLTGNKMIFHKASENVLGTAGTGYAQFDHSVLLPASRIVEIEYGTSGIGGSESGYVRCSDDGVNVTAYLSADTGSLVADTSVSAWGNMTYSASIMLPFLAGRYFATSAYTCLLLVHMVNLNR